jgi:hypothetical protein
MVKNFILHQNDELFFPDERLDDESNYALIVD